MHFILMIKNKHLHSMINRNISMTGSLEFTWTILLFFLYNAQSRSHAFILSQCSLIKNVKYINER